MTFGIDFDGTWTADPELFQEFVMLLLARGHRPIIVTARRDDWMRSDSKRHWGNEVRTAIAELPAAGIPIVFAGPDLPKALAARQAGYTVDVWIYDCPAAIGCCHAEASL